MGLDMYLYEQVHLPMYPHLAESSDAYREAMDKARKIVEILGVTAEEDNTLNVQVPIAYWRKANQVHAWFVRNVQSGVDDCGEYYLNRDKLTELRDVCAKVLADHALAKELLPTQEGFFFGSYDYDEWYFKDLEYTVETLNGILSRDTGQWSKDYTYNSSW